ncbi:hypothetical protein [Photobacterium sanguinicancri]|uniref:DUF4760 domain-containing protein n=1 Tax=Photobacterium sanguinicancri TaxID=875932 RepID=A0AAW7YFF5_9GAMM|nr:hypothetical protein [Photobacterium sanguinicancri]MDO6545365.1 hypothetical protein [Photobacterium sanguinicancri]
MEASIGVFNAALGPFIGFLGAVILFFLKEKWTSFCKKKSTISNLKLEIHYNINLYSDFIKQLSSAINAVSSGSKHVYVRLDYDFIATFFAKEYYNSGLLLTAFHVEDLKRWNVMLSSLSAGYEQKVLDSLEEWRTDKGISQDELFHILDHELKQVRYAKEMSEYVLSKL